MWKCVDVQTTEANLCSSQIQILHTMTGRRGRNRMVVGFTTTYVISAYHN